MSAVHRVQPPGSVAAREWRWVAGFGALVMALTTVPYVVGWLSGGAAWQFSGFVFGVEDGNSYIAKMLRGAYGAWLFQLSYSTEPHPRALMFLFHILLGKLTGALVGTGDALRLHGALVVAYHAARVLCGLALLAASYRFLAEFLTTIRWRRAGLALVALGGGLGWLQLLLRWPRVPLDFYSPEAFTFLDLYGLPHLSAARALVLAGVVCYWSSLRTGHLGKAWWASAFWLGAALIQPFYVALVYALVGLQLALLFVVRHPAAPRALRAGLVLLGARPPTARHPGLHRGDAENAELFVVFSANSASLRCGQPAKCSCRAALVAVSLSAPIVAYTILLFRIEPVYRQWSRQNLILSPPPLDYLAAWGLLLVPAFFGLRVLRRRNLVAWSWVLVWLLALPLMLYAPYDLQRRTSEGVQVALVGLALPGASVAIPALLRSGARAFRRWAPLVLLAALLPSSLLLLVGGVAAARTDEPVFLPTGAAHLFACLAQQLPPGAPVLSAFETGNALPAYAPVVAYIGHGPETVFLADKRPVVAAFFGPGATPAARLGQWKALGRPAIVFGPHEAAQGGQDFSAPEYRSALRPICAADGYTTYVDAEANE